MFLFIVELTASRKNRRIKDVFLEWSSLASQTRWKFHEKPINNTSCIRLLMQGGNHIFCSKNLPLPSDPSLHKVTVAVSGHNISRRTVTLNFSARISWHLKAGCSWGTKSMQPPTSNPLHTFVKMLSCSQLQQTERGEDKGPNSLLGTLVQILQTSRWEQVYVFFAF